jgi:hypothetical protein
MHRLFYLIIFFLAFAPAIAAQACEPMRLSLQNKRADLTTAITCEVNRDSLLARQLTSRAKRDMSLDRKTAAGIRMSVRSHVHTEIKATLSNQRLISLIESRNEYFGGPHGMTYFRSLTWDLKRHRPLTLQNLLVDPRTNGPTLTSLARFTRAQLAEDWRKELQILIESPDEKWESSIRPDLKTFKAWTLESGSDGKASGIMIYFEPYHVAGYIDGPQKVFLPFSTISSLIKSEHQVLFSQH